MHSFNENKFDNTPDYLQIQQLTKRKIQEILFILKIHVKKKVHNPWCIYPLGRFMVKILRVNKN